MSTFRVCFIDCITKKNIVSRNLVDPTLYSVTVNDKTFPKMRGRGKVDMQVFQL